MEDLYYLTPANIKLDDITVWSVEQGYRFERSTFDWDTVNILFDINDYCQVSLLGQADVRAFSEDRVASHINQGFYINYRGVTPYLKQLLKALLEKFGGWIDCATESQKGMFTVENMDSLDCITLIMEEADEMDD